ncbi:MAG TPA: glycosyltransferase family 87 protein [Tepidisphaeraceae bacterium]|nr:glycosyltransferase family 87 protein [Tepidisphaeraceae bacterium]
MSMSTELIRLGRPGLTIAWLRLAKCLSLGVCAIAVFVTVWRGPLPVDTPQYYMGGLMARTGGWADLYPIPVRNSMENAGYPEASVSTQAYSRRSAAVGAPNTFRFIESPPVAAVLAPLSLVSLKMASRCWQIGLGVCIWMTGVQAGAIYRRLVGRRTLIEGVIVLATVLLPRPWIGVWLGNISPLEGCCVGGATLALLDKRTGAAIAWILTGLFAKYTTLAVLLVVLVRGQWRIMAGVVCGALSIVIATLPFCGMSPYLVFARQIWPTLQRPTLNWTNQSLFGVAAQLINDPNCLSHAVSLLVVARWLAFCAITCLLWLRRSSMETYPSMCVAGVLVVLCWLQLFGPLTWSHYAVFFSPFLGMMVCLAGRGGAWAAVLWCAMLLAFLPWRSIAAPQVMQNALSHFGLSAALLVFATIAVACLVTRRTCSLVVFAGGDES